MSRERKIDDKELEGIAGGAQWSKALDDDPPAGGSRPGVGTPPPGRIPGGGANDPEPVDSAPTDPPSNSDLF